MNLPVSARARRVLATTAAALVVVVIPTACGTATAATGGDDPTRPVSAEADTGHEDHGPTSSSAPPPADPDPDPERDGDGDGDEDEDGGEDREADAPADDPKPALEVLGRDCGASDLEPHEGFQDAPRCVDTAFGEVADEERNPSLLITSAPQSVAAGEAFEIEVSTRNLVRDRFLGAKDGGYYLESSFLTPEGIQRGHFHTACRMLPSTDVAPDAAPEPVFFVATQDGGGGARPDSVTVPVPEGLPGAGTAQCAVWAGDGSHRIPMMQRANQVPAFDIIRIEVAG